MGGSVHTITKNAEVLVVASKEKGLEVNIGKSKYMIMSRDQNAGRSRSTHILTYLLTPWSRDPLEKLTGSAASQETPRIFGTRRFLTVPTSARHQSLS